jgi:hypothetical protein
MNSRAIHELPVPILTDDELLQEYDHTFNAALDVNSVEDVSTANADAALRRNSATMGELLRRGYRSAGPHWHRSEDSIDLTLRSNRR